MELISVIVPVYNVKQYLLRCVESIQNQTYKNLEIILVDDGSPDDCPRMCDELMMTDSRIKVVHKKNEGLGLARNSGLNVATGSYVTFIDSDDWISNAHIENLYLTAEKYQADAVIGAHTRVNSDGTMSPRLISLEEGVYEGDSIINDIILPLIGANADYHDDVQINSSSCMNLYSMDIIKSNNIKFISEKYAVAEDFYFNVDFFNNSRRLAYVKETGYYYFENTESISRKYNPLRFERTLNYYQKCYEQAAKYGLTDKVEYRIDRSFLMKIRVALRLIILSDLKRKEKLREIRIILEHDTVKTVLSNYPIDTYILPMRILAKMMRNNNAVGVYYLMKFREKSRDQRLLKKVLKSVGIGN